MLISTFFCIFARNFMRGNDFFLFKMLENYNK